MQIVSKSHPWHTECKCFETGIVPFGQSLPEPCCIWLEADSGETVVFRRVAKNDSCICRKCKLTQQQHAYLDKIGAP